MQVAASCSNQSNQNMKMQTHFKLHISPILTQKRHTIFEYLTANTCTAKYYNLPLFTVSTRLRFRSVGILKTDSVF